MEGSRSPRRSSSSGSCRAPRVTLPVQHSALALSPSPSWHPTEGVGLAGVIPPPPPPTLTWNKPGPAILCGLNWKPNMEFYDYQKIKGLRFPRLIQPSIWSQSLNIAGQDPLQLPLSKVLQGGKENFWLRISGKEIYLAPTGKVCHIVFVNEILNEFRNRGLNLIQLAQSRAAHDGIPTSDSRALQHLARFLTEQLQAWIPNPQHQAQERATIAALQAELSALKAGSTPNRPLQRDSIYT